jgi:protein tyrosine phosphatase (PTP) superfamily phosphohydrolase (DUF442 family)
MKPMLGRLIREEVRKVLKEGDWEAVVNVRNDLLNKLQKLNIPQSEYQELEKLVYDLQHATDVFWVGSLTEESIREEVRRVLKEDEGSLFSQIKHGSRVTIVNKFGQEIVGKAVMLGPAGWVINIGGRYGTPAIASPENVIRVKN